MLFDPERLIADMTAALESVQVERIVPDALHLMSLPLDDMLRAIADGEAVALDDRGSLRVDLDRPWFFDSKPDDHTLHDYDDSGQASAVIRTWATPGIRNDAPEAARHVAAVIAYRDRHADDGGLAEAARSGKALFTRMQHEILRMPEACVGCDVVMNHPSPKRPGGGAMLVMDDGTRMRATAALADLLGRLPQAVMIWGQGRTTIEGWWHYARIDPTTPMDVLRRLSEHPTDARWFAR